MKAPNVQFWGGLALGLAAGLAIELHVQESSPPPPGTRAEKTPGTFAPSLPEGSPERSSSPSGDREAPARPRPATALDLPSRPTHPSPDRSAAEVAELKAKVAELDKQLTEARMELEESAPMHPPEQLSDRFSEKAIVAALNAALRETGSTAQLTSVDCTEYPCIAYFDSLSSKDLAALKLSDAYRAYAHDNFVNIGKGPDGPFDGLVALPQNDTNTRNDLIARIKFRRGQLPP